MRAGAPPEPLGPAVARGAGWFLGLSALGKGLSLVNQLVLAWLLLPAEIGVAALVMGAAAVVTFLSWTNLQVVLVQRQREFDALAGDVFWVSLGVGAVAGGLLAGAAPLVARAYDAPALAPLVLVFAAGLPLQAPSAVYAAALERDLRFRTLALAQFAMSALVYAGTALMALLGAGAAAIVVPHVAGSVVMTGVLRALAGRQPIGWPVPRRWPALLGPALWVMALGTAAALQPHAANLVVGLVRPTAVVGLFAWGAAVAAQTGYLLASRLQQVLFPAFAKLQEEPSRARGALTDGARALLLLTVPLTVAQALAAPALVPAVFGTRWAPAVPVVQLVGLAVGLQPLNALATSVLLARGAYARAALLAAGGTALVALAAGLGATGGLPALAAATAAAMAVVSVVHGAVGFREVGAGLRALTGVIAPPLAAGGTALFAGSFAGAAAPAGELLDAVVAVLAAALTFAAVLRLAWPTYLSETVTAVRRRLPTRGKAPASAPAGEG